MLAEMHIMRDGGVTQAEQPRPLSSAVELSGITFKSPVEPSRDLSQLKPPPRSVPVIDEKEPVIELHPDNTLTVSFDKETRLIVRRGARELNKLAAIPLEM